MAAQLKKEKKYKDSLFHYLRVYILELSGLCNSSRVEHPKVMNYNSASKHSIKQLVELLEYDEEALFDFFVYTWNKTLPGLMFHYLTLEECFYCLTNSLQDRNEKVKNMLFNAYDHINSLMDKKEFDEKYNLEFPVNFEGKTSK
jgi:hypothetical protein